MPLFAIQNPMTAPVLVSLSQPPHISAGSAPAKTGRRAAGRDILALRRFCAMDRRPGSILSASRPAPHQAGSQRSRVMRRYSAFAIARGRPPATTSGGERAWRSPHATVHPTYLPPADRRNRRPQYDVIIVGFRVTPATAPILSKNHCHPRNGARDRKVVGWWVATPAATPRNTARNYLQDPSARANKKHGPFTKNTQSRTELQQIHPRGGSLPPPPGG